MRTPQLSALVFAMLTFSAVAAEPQKLWEASGFKQPESVVFDRAAGAIYVSNVNGDPMKKDAMRKDMKNAELQRLCSGR